MFLPAPIIAVAMAVAAAAESGQPVKTVHRVDLNRYAGQWFEIARFPNRFQTKCTGNVRATYTRRPDGTIDVLNECSTTQGVTSARGVARVVDEASSSKLKVRFAPSFLSFLPFVWGDYWILGLADDYSWAVVGSPDRKYLWILARTRQLDSRRYDAALAAARSNEFDVGRLVKTNQAAPDKTGTGAL